jgi:hypothetical protein
MTDAQKPEQEYDIVEPYAPAMIESLRAVGYDLPTAVADLIDNSISACATQIDLIFEWNGEESVICVADNGLGMDESHLIRAMRIGSTDPTETREKNDLGRFGLGLKTASFSQCRAFTVHTKTEGGGIATRRWDLDYVRETKGWRILKAGTTTSLRFAGGIRKSGTVVVWEKLDRVVGGTAVDNPRDRDVFNERVESVEKHVAMVFHRFIRGTRRIRLTVNGRPVAPWDPFLEDHNATQHPDSHDLKLRGEKIAVDCFILPHHSKLSAEQHADAAGPRGWLAHQGFYIYRNSRLLVPGDWLDLGVRKEEHYKLARIRVDIPNMLDDLWDIDVKKSTAKVPGGIRRELTGIGRVTREKASDVYRHRGKVVHRTHGPKETFVWEQKVKHGKIFYHVNRDHPLIARLLAEAKPYRSTIKALLRLVEETVPVPLIVLTSAEKPDQAATPFESAPSSEIYNVMIELFLALKHSGLSERQAIGKLHTIEPFDRFPEYVENLPDTLKAQGIK